MLSESIKQDTEGRIIEIESWLTPDIGHRTAFGARQACSATYVKGLQTSDGPFVKHSGLLWSESEKIRLHREALVQIQAAAQGPR